MSLYVVLVQKGALGIVGYICATAVLFFAPTLHLPLFLHVGFGPGKSSQVNATPPSSAGEGLMG